MQKHELLGVEICCAPREELFAQVRARLYRGGVVATVNPTMLMRARREPTFAAVLRGALCIPDGVGIRLAFALRGIATDVFPGVELGERLLDCGAPRVLFYGARPSVVRRAVLRLRARHPAMRVVGVFDGYETSDQTLRAALSERSPDLCLICLGSPRQEQLAARLSAHAPATLFIGLGGAFDVYAGAVRRAPLVLRRMGLEWLARALREPRRILGFGDLLGFAMLAFGEGLTAFYLKMRQKWANN